MFIWEENNCRKSIRESGFSEGATSCRKTSSGTGEIASEIGESGEESEEDNYSDKDEDDSESVTDKTVTHRNRPDSKLPMRVTRQSREEEKVTNIEFHGVEEYPEGFAPNDMENNDIEDESKNEEIFNWDEYFDKSALYVVDAKVKGNLGRYDTKS